MKASQKEVSERHEHLCPQQKRGSFCVGVSEVPDAIEEWGTRTMRNYVTLSTGLATLSIYPSVDEETLFYKPKKK